MPSLLLASAETIDKLRPSRLQQLAGPMYVKGRHLRQHYSSLVRGHISK